ncbi:kinase [Ornithinibacillus californiensis]|uniref:kinase n=1 Tax=Ornithinibacillus californiensis TaxID=161536 RepID=UPI00064DD781|nr:kinase [Ornithinibacillus californiensis]
MTICLNELASEIVYKFNKRSNIGRSYIIAFDGLSGAGKTTLVNKLDSLLKQKCNVVVIHMDDHIEKRSARYNTGHEEWYEYYYLQWDTEILKDEIFRSIHNGNTKLTLPYYEKSSDKNYAKNISVPLNSIVLIEGIFLQRKEWKAYYDYTIFIDCPREIRYERVLNRDSYIGDKQAILDKYKRRYWLGEEYYLRTVNPMENANKILKCNGLLGVVNSHGQDST